MWPPARMPQSPIRHDGVLARSLRQLARLGIASLRPPYARIWGFLRPGPAWQGVRARGSGLGRNPAPGVRSWEARDPHAGGLRQASCQHGVMAEGPGRKLGHPCDRILRGMVAWREGIPAACSSGSVHEAGCFFFHAKTP